MLVRQVVADGGVQLSVIRLADRRPGAQGETVWTPQKQLETALYQSGYGTSTGAIYRLLHRAGVGDRSLPLKKAAIGEGLITEGEYDFLYAHLGGRSFTLVPHAIIPTALECFGRGIRSEAVLRALELPWPAAWLAEEERAAEEGGGLVEEEQEAEEVVGGSGGAEVVVVGGGGEEGEDDEEEEEEEDEEEDDDDDEEGDEDSDGDGGGAGGAVGSSPPPGPDTEPEDDEPDAGSPASKRSKYALTPSPALERELQAFAVWRMTPMNRSRAAAAATPATVKGDRGCVLRLMGWLDAQGKLPATGPTLACFASNQMGCAAERYVTMLTAEQGLSYKTAANHLGSFIAAARYAATRCSAASPSTLSELESLHKAAKKQAKQQQLFAAASEQEVAIAWPAVLQARVSAEAAFSAYKGGSLTKKIALTRDVLVLRLHSDSPPDRVRILRELQLGSTLKKRDGGYDLDLRMPGLHKTSAALGPSLTTLSPSVVPWIDQWIKLTSVQEGGLLFGCKGGGAISPSNWTAMVKSLFYRHAGVAVAPKDLRASYITHMRSGQHGDESLRAAAIAMRHSPATQSSSAYHKRNALAQSAVAEATSLSAQYVHG